VLAVNNLIKNTLVGRLPLNRSTDNGRARGIVSYIGDAIAVALQEEFRVPARGCYSAREKFLNPCNYSEVKMKPQKWNIVLGNGESLGRYTFTLWDILLLFPYCRIEDDNVFLP